MSFPPRSSFSKSQINKAGKFLVTDAGSDLSLTKENYEVVNSWRISHQYPMNTFRASLTHKLKKYRGVKLLTQRLKRMNTIIDKLKREPSMNITTMQDHAGLRVIFSNVKDVHRLANHYRKISETKNFKHSLIRDNDYIDNPKQSTGYRSIHLVYKYKNPTNELSSSYEDMMIELQIRTDMQHSWATAVETVDMFLGEKVKSGKGNEEWSDFFKAVSSAFSYIEGTTPVYPDLSREDTFKLVKEREAVIGAKEILHGFHTIALHGSEIEFRDLALIVVNIDEKSVRITTFANDDIDQANSAYLDYEMQASQGKRIEPVLVTADSLEALKKGYSSFFSNVNTFIYWLNVILDGADMIIASETAAEDE